MHDLLDIGKIPLCGCSGPSAWVRSLESGPQVAHTSVFIVLNETNTTQTTRFTEAIETCFTRANQNTKQSRHERPAACVSSPPPSNPPLVRAGRVQGSVSFRTWQCLDLAEFGLGEDECVEFSGVRFSNSVKKTARMTGCQDFRQF